MELFASHCVFPTPDIRRTADYYQHMLGFRRVDYLDAKEQHICLYRDGVEFILTQSNGQKVIPNHVLYGYGGDAYVIVKDQAALQNEYEKKVPISFSGFIRQIITIRNSSLKTLMGVGFISE